MEKKLCDLNTVEYLINYFVEIKHITKIGSTADSLFFVAASLHSIIKLWANYKCLVNYI